MPKRITLSDEDYEILLNELHSLYGYHWNDDKHHARDCGSKVVDVIEACTETVIGTSDEIYVAPQLGTCLSHLPREDTKKPLCETSHETLTDT